jgi:hypothetical protein
MPLSRNPSGWVLSPISPVVLTEKFGGKSDKFISSLSCPKFSSVPGDGAPQIGATHPPLIVVRSLPTFPEANSSQEHFFIFF